MQNKILILITTIFFISLTAICYAEDNNLFSFIAYYYQSKGSRWHNILTINNDWTAEYYRPDNIYSDKNFYLPGKATGKIPVEIANKILANLRDFKFDSNQKPHPLSITHQSLLVIRNLSGKIIEQPYPDEQHLELLPAYNEIEEVFLQAIQYINEHGNTAYISFEANATLDDERFVTFTFKIINTGNTAITIENLYNMDKFASSFYSKTGVGPRYNKNNTILLNANFDLKQEIIQFIPNEPLLMEFLSKEPVTSGPLSFSIALKIKEVNDSGEEICIFTTGSVVVSFDLN